MRVHGWHLKKKIRYDLKSYILWLFDRWFINIFYGCTNYDKKRESLILEILVVMFDAISKYKSKEGSYIENISQKHFMPSLPFNHLRHHLFLHQQLL